MKTLLLALSLTAAIAAPFSGSATTLRLNLEPDRDIILKGSPQEVVVKIDLAAITDKRHTRRTPLNLAVVLDRSGSMTGAKLEKARQAAAQLVDRLGPDDVFSLVVYSDTARVLVPAQRVEDKSALKRQIARIEAGGSTALFAGVKSGADQLGEYLSARRINRIILLSDGLANVGPSSTRDLRRLGHELSTKGMAVTTIGLGDDYNEDLMAGLAEASDANYYYVKDTEKLPQIFAKELGELMTVAARDIRIEIVCPRGVTPIEFIGRPEKFERQQASVKLNQFTLGQNRYLFLRCRVNEPEPEIARVKVTYLDELADGAQQSASAAVRIRFTDSKAVAEKSIRASVVAEKELLLTAVTKDQALADADAGNWTVAATRLESQAAALEAQYQNAPPTVQIRIREEVGNLQSRSQEIRQGNYNAETRKSLQWESYNSRNSKN